MTCQLYRHFDADGNLLYVGVSLGAVARLSQHKTSPWFGQIKTVEIQQCSNREQALDLETAAVRSENPKYNIAKSPDVSAPRKIRIERLASETIVPIRLERRTHTKNNLEKYCKETGISYAHIARLCGVSSATISLIAGDNHVPRFELALKIEIATHGLVGRENWFPPRPAQVSITIGATSL